MDAQIRFLAYVIIHLIFLFIHTLAQSHGGEDEYSDCSQQYNCGTLKDISYPFWGNNRPRSCGSDAFELQCRDNQTTIIVSGLAHFRVVKINQTANTMRMVPEDLIYNDCQFTNTSLNANFFHYLPSVQNVTIFSGCNSGLSIGGNNFTCPILKNDLAFYVNQTQVRQFPELRKQCKFCFQVPALAEIPLEPGGGIDALKEALKQGFDVGYTADWSSCDACMKSGGVCGGESQFSCRCWDGSSQLSACLELKHLAIEMAWSQCF